MGARYVECLLSGYWLQLSERSMLYDGIEYVVVTVMTAQRWTADGRPIKPRKHCELTVSRAELLRGLGTVHPRERDA